MKITLRSEIAFRAKLRREICVEGEKKRIACNQEEISSANPVFDRGSNVPANPVTCQCRRHTDSG